MSIWSDHPEMDDVIRAEHAKGISFSVIGAALTKAFEVKVSRCAVIGRARRIGIPQLPPDRAKFLRAHGHINAMGRTRPMGRPKAKPKPQTVAEPPVVVLPPDVRTPTARPWITRKAFECAFPFREGEETYSCCAKTFGRYCKPHEAVMYAPAPVRKSKAAEGMTVPKMEAAA